MSRYPCKYTFQMRIEQEVQDAINYLKGRGFSVPFRLKTYLIQLAEQEKNIEKIGKKYTV